MLFSFKSKLENAPPETTRMMSPPPVLDTEANAENNDQHSLQNNTEKPLTDTKEEEEIPCDLHFVVGCQSCRAWDKEDQEESDDDAGWMSHALTFAKDRLGKDLEWKRKNEQELVVIDPREKARELGVENKGKKNKDWDRDRDRDRGKGKK